MDKNFVLFTSYTPENSTSLTKLSKTKFILYAKYTHRCFNNHKNRNAVLFETTSNIFENVSHYSREGKDNQEYQIAQKCVAVLFYMLN